MKPYYEHAGITIYHGDCREVLPELEYSSADILLTSPPYNCKLAYIGYEDNLAELEFRAFNAQWISRATRIMRDPARAYLVLSDRMLWWIRDQLEIGGWTFGQLLTWCKPNLAGGGKISGDWNYLTENIILARKGTRAPMQDGGFDVMTHSYFEIASPQTNFNGHNSKEHPAQWPIELPSRLLSRTPGAVVLDPFAGSGAGLIAAKNLGRRAIGIEIGEKYCEIAAKRLSQEILQF